MVELTEQQGSVGLEDDLSEHETWNSKCLHRLTGTCSPLLAQQVLLDLRPRRPFDGIYFLLLNACVPVFEPRVIHHSFFAAYTIVNVVCNVCFAIYSRTWGARVSKNPTRAVQWFTFFKIVQNASLASLTGWTFLAFGINSITSLATMALIAFAVGTIVTLRPSLWISRATLLCCLMPAVLVSVWLGGRAGYGTAVLLFADILFLWAYGKRVNSEYLRVLSQTQELMASRRKATQTGARIGDTLLANVARHSAIVAERNRIAFEWHDTLLAGFSAISWQLAEAQRRQKESPETAADAIALAANMLQHYRAEARLVIADLLYEDAACEDLVKVLRESSAKILGIAKIKLEISTCGKPVLLSPDVVRQLSRICDEAIRTLSGTPSRLTFL